MDEEGVGKSEKAGVSRKLVAGIIVAAVVTAGIGVVLWQNSRNNESADSIPILILNFDTEYTDAEWRIILVNITTNTNNYYADPNATVYHFINANGFAQDSNYIGYIKDTASSFGIKWHDVGNDDLLTVGDYLTIDRNGGDSGKLDFSGYIEIISYSIHSIIFLPPAEFLDMDVVKTPAGWNMTVTWVNGTVPEVFLEGWNVSFRLENKSGEFLTSYQNDCSFWLGFIRFPLPEYNHVDQGFYNITWYDYDENRIISLNDTFVIDNYSSLVEADYTLRLMSNKYGSGHTMIEVVLV